MNIVHFLFESNNDNYLFINDFSRHSKQNIIHN